MEISASTVDRRIEPGRSVRFRRARSPSTGTAYKYEVSHFRGSANAARPDFQSASDIPELACGRFRRISRPVPRTSRHRHVRRVREPRKVVRR